MLTYQELEEENLDQKSPGPPGWGLVQEASPLLIEKRTLLRKAHWNIYIYIQGGWEVSRH